MAPLAHALVILSAEDTDAPTLPGVATVSTEDAWDDGGFAIGRDAVGRGALWCDRPYWTGTPAPDWLADRLRAPIAAGARVQIGNELNLDLEGFQGGPAAYFALEDAVRAALGADAAALVAMPPSPGVPEWQSWVRRPGDHAVHAYGSFAQMQDVVRWYLEATGGLLYVTECNFGAGNSCPDLGAWCDEHLVPFLDWCASEPRVVFVAYFAWVWRGAPAMPTPVDAKDTAVTETLVAWSALDPGPPIAGGSALPWEGTTLTVWNLPDDPATLVEAARALGADCIEIKTADGASSWLGPARNLTTDYVAALRRGGSWRIAGWSYNYCDLRTGLDATTRTPAARFGRSLARLRARRSWDRGDGIPELEAQAAAAAVTALDLDGHTFDLESECEGHADLVAIMLSTARAMLPQAPFGAHTWAAKSGHESYPWTEIASGVDVVRPMCYRPTWTAETMYAPEELGLWVAPLVHAPVWGITETVDTVEALGEDQACAEQHDAAGAGFWEFSGLPGQPGVVDWIASLGDAAPPPDLASLQQRSWDLLDEVQAIAGEWEELGWPSTGSGLASAAESGKSLVRASKGER